MCRIINSVSLGGVRNTLLVLVPYQKLKAAVFRPITF